MAIKPMTEAQAREKLSNRIGVINNSVQNMGALGDLVQQSCTAYQRKWGKPMSPGSRASLVSSLNQMTDILQRRDHISKEAIMSATADIANVQNPITLLYNLMSILIPNFSYSLVTGLQPIPTKESSILYPQITAAESRNNVIAGTPLLGAGNWCQANNYSSNRVSSALTLTTGATAVAFIAPEANMRANSVAIQLTTGTGSATTFDDGLGTIVPVAGYITSGTVNYATGDVALVLAAAAAAGDTASIVYRYNPASGTKPAQAVLEWVSKPIVAEPYQLRSTYALDNFYQAKQVLNGYNIDQVLSSSLSGYINKEISGSVFDDLLMRTDATYTWDDTPVGGVAWALHRFSVVNTILSAGNGIRANIARCGGNVITAGTDWCTLFEGFGSDVWEPKKYDSEPIGSYLAGRFLGRFDVIKNQDYPAEVAVMSFKQDDLSASFLGGVFIALYATNPVSLDDLQTIQGYATQFGTVKAFDNSIVRLLMT